MSDEQRTYDLDKLTIRDMRTITKRSILAGRNDGDGLALLIPDCVDLLERVAPWALDLPPTEYNAVLNNMIEALNHASDPKSSSAPASNSAT